MPGSISPTLPGLSFPQTYAAWPVWGNSTTKEVEFHPLPKRVATRLWHRARDFDRRTHRHGRHGGAVGHSALQVLHALVFDFLNYSSGRLDPSYAAIARKANLCERTVASALRRLRDLGILTWIRRCREQWQNGRFTLEQETNAYAILPPTQWRGYTPPPDVPPPHPATWGATPPLPSPLAAATALQRQGSDVRQIIAALKADPGDALAAALARLGTALQAKP